MRSLLLDWRARLPFVSGRQSAQLVRFPASPMKTRYGQFNPKRRMLEPNAASLARLHDLAARVQYGGNPEHKRNPGDFGLTPPSDPRPAKSLCDTASILSQQVAQDLLREGLRRGMASDRFDREWPKNIWAVTSDGIPLEAQLENAERGVYHGYPMPETDPMTSRVIGRWNG